ELLVALDAQGRPVKGWPIQSTPEKRYLAGHQGAITCVAFSPDGRQLASVSKDGTARIWDVSSGALLHTCSDSPVKLQEVTYSPPGNPLPGGDWLSGTIRLWDPSTGKPRGPPITGSVGVLWRLRFDGTGRRLAASGSKGVAVWSLATSGGLVR